MRTKTDPITSRRLLLPLPTHHRPCQLEPIAPEDEVHSRALSAGGDVDGVQGSILTRSGAGSGDEEEDDS